MLAGASTAPGRVPERGPGRCVLAGGIPRRGMVGPVVAAGAGAGEVDVVQDVVRGRSVVVAEDEVSVQAMNDLTRCDGVDFPLERVQIDGRARPLDETRHPTCLANSLEIAYPERAKSRGTYNALPADVRS